MGYRVAVGDRVWNRFENKQKAIEVCHDLSTIYTDVECRVIHKNWNTVKGTPVYMNGVVKL